MSSDSPEKPGWLPRLLAQLTRLVIASPRTTLLWVAVSCVMCVGSSVLWMKFKTDRSDLIDHRADFHQRWLKFADEFGETSDAVVVVESRNKAAVLAAMDDIGQRLEQDTDHFQRVQWKFDPAVMKPHGLQFLPPAVLDQAVQGVRQFAPILESNRWDLISLASYGQRLSRHLESMIQRKDEAGAYADIAQATQLASSLAAFIQDPLQFQSPWPEPIPRDAAGDAAQLQAVHYNVNSKGTMGFVLAVPVNSTTDFSGGAASLKRLRMIVAEAELDHPDVVLGLTGIPILEADEMSKSQEDMTLASAISFGGVAFLLIFGFRSLRHPLISLVMLLVGLCWSLGFITAAIGHLNILSVSFATILMGLGIDFAIHFLERYLELRHQGQEMREAIIITASTTGAGIATCALTTSLAFFCAGVTSFLGIAELGIIAGGGVILCALAAFVALPPLICMTDQNVAEAKLPHAFAGTPLRFATNRFPGAIVVLTLMGFIVLTGLGIGKKGGKYVSKVKYDSNLLNLQARGVPSVELQHHMFEESDGSLLYAVSVAKSPAEVRELREKFLALPTVGRVEELASLLPRFPEEETQVYLIQLQQILGQIPDLPADNRPVDPEQAGRALERLYSVLKALPDSQSQQASASLSLFFNALQSIPPEQQVRLLTGYQQGMRIALHTQLRMMAEVSNASPVIDSIPEALRSRFISSQGNWCLRIFPKAQIWEEEPLAEFVRDIRSIDPEATGTPLQNYEAANQIKESYQHAAILACAMVLFVLLIDLLSLGPLLIATLSPLIVVGFALNSPGAREAFGIPGIAVLYMVLVFVVAAIFDTHNIGKAILAMLPPLGGGLMTFGILALLKTNLNPANMIVLPLLLGIGVDSGVYVVHDYRSQAVGGYKISSSIINAILLTSTTTMVGFGSMIVSSHQGLASLGLVLTVGVGSCLFISLVPLPAFLTLLDRARARAAGLTEAESHPGPQTVAIAAK